MNKPNKISYKTYFNNRLREVHWHGFITYPLYLQITYKRKSIFFKSYYFELLSKPKYINFVTQGQQESLLATVRQKEIELCEFLIQKVENRFLLDKFKEQYIHYSKDLLNAMEPCFVNYIATFFSNEGLITIADVFRINTSKYCSFELINDIKRSLKPEMNKKLIDYLFTLAPPYLQLYQYLTVNPPQSYLQTFSVWEYTLSELQIIEFLKQYYPNTDYHITLKSLQSLLLQQY